ncbi:MAG: ABC transporter substrate-binding protein [Burkholderiales bacterium]|nr:ABC transporter substrate-binding protein [Burkholderiales bacterium]
MRTWTHYPTPSNALLSRRNLLVGGAAAVASAALPAVAQAQSSVLRLGFIGPGKKPGSASGYALAQGHLVRELAPLGYTEVSTHVFPNGPDLNEALAAGSLDVGIYGDTPAVVAKSRGVDGKLIGFDNLGMNVWLLTPQGGVKTVKELEGKVVAVALGSYMHRYVLGLLKEAGILKTTKVVYMLPRDGEVGLEKGSVAAFAAPINTGPLLASRGYPVIDEADRHPSLRGSAVIVASGKALANAPTLGAAWLRARRAAIADIRKDPDRYYSFHADASGFPVAVVKESYPVSRFPDEAYPATGLQALEDIKVFLLGENLIKQDFNIAQWKV